MEKFKINEVNYVYDFENMTAEQILLCQSAWELSEAIKKIIPANNDDLIRIMEKRVNNLGYEYLLMAEGKDGKLIRSTKNKNIAIGILENMLGADFEKLEACKNDFFQRRGIISESLINITKSLLGSEELMKLIQGQGQLSGKIN